MSVSPATLGQDQAKLATDMATYSSDKISANQLISHDKAQINADSLAGRKLLASLQKTLAKDQATRKSLLQTDRNDEKMATLADKGIIGRDNLTIKVDKNNPTQLATDKQKLIADEIQLESDHVKFTTMLDNDDATTQSTILFDQQAIVTARSTSNNAALLADQQTLLHDQQTSLSTLAADQILILNDQLKVTQDTASA
jgi:hypothetical protein